MSREISRAPSSRFAERANTRNGPSPAYFRLSHLRKMKGRQQVAAVCYRRGDDGVEFLLVETRRRRWTFPKGSAEPGLTHAQAAALEAYEEAGVHGRIEEEPFTCYVRSKRGKHKAKSSPSSSPQAGSQKDDHEIFIDAHLCEVLRLSAPEEARRNPTWFSVAKAKRRLREDRAPAYGDELARVVDLAVARVRMLHSAPAPGTQARVIDSPLPAVRRNGSAAGNGAAKAAIPGERLSQGGTVESSGAAVERDALQKVQFEASAAPDRVQAAFLRYRSREITAPDEVANRWTASGHALAIDAYVSDAPPRAPLPPPRAQVTTIDQARKPNHKASFRQDR